MKQRRVFAFVLAAILVGCSSPPSTSPISASSGGGALPMTSHAIGFGFSTYVTNYIQNRYVWVTRYWSYKPDSSWHIEGVACLAPNGTWSSGIQFHSPELGPQIKIRAEITDPPQCSGRVVSDVWSAKCDLSTHYLNTPISTNYGYIEIGPTTFNGTTYAWSQFHNNGGAPPCK